MRHCQVINCQREAIADDDGQLDVARPTLCERHMPNPHVRSWAEMKADGIEIETMSEYVAEVRGFND